MYSIYHCQLETLGIDEKLRRLFSWSEAMGSLASHEIDPRDDGECKI
jgi:hypothetical protein